MKNLLFYCRICYNLMLYSCADDLNTEREYKGPKSTTEFETLLRESSHPVLKALDLDTKESLVECTLFIMDDYEDLRK